MLTSDELTAMQAVHEETMTQTATITRYTLSSDGAGGTTRSSTTDTEVCRLAPTKNMAVATQYAGRLAERLPWQCTFPADADVQDDDMITVDGRDFEVVGILGPYGFETALVCILAERE